MARHDFAFADLETMINAAPEGERFRGVDRALISRMNDLDLRRIVAALRMNAAPESARISALAEQELADRAARSARWTLFFAAAGVAVGVVGVIATLL